MREGEGTIRRALRRLPRWVVAAAALGALGVFAVTALAATGAGGSRSKSPQADAGRFAQFRQCMSDHGIQPPSNSQPIRTMASSSPALTSC